MNFYVGVINETVDYIESNIGEAFIDDLYRWIMVKEAELNPNGIGMVNV